MLSHGKEYAFSKHGPVHDIRGYGPRRWFSTCRPLFRTTSFCGLSEQGLMARKNRNHRGHEYVISFPASRPYDVIVWTMYPCHHDQDARYYRILICNPSLNTSLFLVSRKFREGRKFWRAGIRQTLVSQFPSRFSKVKSWICPIHEASVLFASASKTPDKYRALG